MLRNGLVRLHRWFGLATAVFLFVAGFTGAIISWDHEIDEWLNPDFFEARTEGRPLPVTELVARIEADDPRVRVTFHPLAVEPGRVFLASVRPRVDAATGRLHEPGYNQVAVDPVTGQVQARRDWGAVSLARENLLPFLYKLHYTMHLPDVGAFRLGVFFMGIVAIVWVIDSLVALWISFPRWSQWRRSFALRWSAGGHKLLFDVHRSGGVWLFALLLVLAVTSVGMNLRNEVMVPIVSAFSDLAPSPFRDRKPAPPAQPIEPVLSMSEAVQRATAHARERGVTLPAGAVSLSTAYGVWRVGFFEGDNHHGDGGLGNPWVNIDSRTGEFVGAVLPGEGSAGDIFMQSLFPLHSGRIIGIPGRILMTVLGLAVAAFSVTGVVIWARKRRARAAQSARVARSEGVSLPHALRTPH